MKSKEGRRGKGVQRGQGGSGRERRRQPHNAYLGGTNSEVFPDSVLLSLLAKQLIAS